jgi:hypothetical protein
MSNNHGDVIFKQVNVSKKIRIYDVTPALPEYLNEQYILTLNKNKELEWISKSNLSLINTVKINLNTNESKTAFHLGNSFYGLSMGNGTNNGFIPEIIGRGYNETDPGIYIIGKTGNNEPSDIPLIIIDGRSADNTSLKNRPIFGVSSGSYNEFKLIIDENGKVGIGKIPIDNLLEVNGNVSATAFKTNSSSKNKKNIKNNINPYKTYDLRPVTYYNKLNKCNEYGFIAEDVAKVIPELVDKENNPQYILYNGLTALLVSTIKHQKDQIEKLEDRIKHIETLLPVANKYF